MYIMTWNTNCVHQCKLKQYKLYQKLIIMHGTVVDALEFNA